MHWATVVSGVVHVGGAIALIVYSFWSIEKLKPRYVPISFISTAAAQTPAPPPPPPPLGGGQVTKVKPDRKPRMPKEITQPTQVERKIIEEETDGETGDPEGEVGGEPGGQPGGQFGGILDGIPGGIPGGTGNAPVTPPEKPPVVAPAMIEGSRIAGNSQIQLPEPTKQIMSAQGIRETSAAVKMCLTADGVPSTLAFQKRTGFADADQKIEREMKTWRYRPYRVAGKAVPVCTSIIFRYFLR